jgi:hypothetical protein
MMKIPDGRRGLVRSLGLAAAAMLMLSAATSERAEALSPINPASVPSAKHVTDGLTTEVRGGHGGHGGGHGGGHHGGGFHGGGRGFHGGGAAFHGGGFRSGHVFHGGFRGHRFAHRHHFHRHFYYAPSYYYYPHRCRVVWTYYGPRRICRYRGWHHHHWRHHYRHYRYW